MATERQPNGNQEGSKLNYRAIEALPRGKWLSQSLGRGRGVLVVRSTSKGKVFYFRYTTPEGKRDSLPLGPYSRNGGNGGLSLKAATEKAGELSRLLQDHPHLRQWIEEKHHLEKARLEQQRRDREIATLEALLKGYVTWLHHQGKDRSAKDVANLFKRRVIVPFPEIASKLAREVTTTDLRQVVAATLEAGAGREATKLRSCLLSAFNAALAGDEDPTIPTCLQGFGLELNPAQAIRVTHLRQYNQPRDRCLAQRELQALWRRLEGVKSLAGAVLRLAVILGGQRPAMVVRMRWQDVSLENGTVTLYDPKGRRANPRPHVLPLPPLAIDLLLQYQENKPFPFSSDGGEHHIKLDSVSRMASRLCQAMLAAGEVQTPFQWRDVRRSIETLLASYGVSKDVRGQLQSHGLSGVQDRHYDRHDYLREKRKAMEMVFRLLTESKPAKVVPIAITR